jgi:hypothetical protein
MYNRLGGYTIGQVWCDPKNPLALAARFPEGTVAFKLLFTTATPSQVPYLQDSFEWQAYVASSHSGARTIQTVRLLQVDLAVRDARAASTTGWVFGTFVYDGTVPGNTPWERLVPLGLMWGNDPTLTRARYQAGDRPVETVILTDTIGGVPQHLGWSGRLNGPVDNPLSSCLSCHSTAQDPYVRSFAPAQNTPDAQGVSIWFTNIASGVPFMPGGASLDYSLQLAVGIRNFASNASPR